MALGKITSKLIIERIKMLLRKAYIVELNIRMLLPFVDCVISTNLGHNCHVKYIYPVVYSCDSF